MSRGPRAVLDLQFLGHAAFAVQMGGVRLCIDPHKPGALGGRFQLPEIRGPFDALLHSHHHEDHSAWTPALGTTRVVDPPCQLGDLQLDARAAFHDRQQGLHMGVVRMLDLRVPGLRVVHSGDLGSWDAADLVWLRGSDVLLIAAGGTWTLGPAQAAELGRLSGARAVVPMHCADPRVDLALQSVDEFAAAWAGPVLRADRLDAATLAGLREPTAVVLARPATAGPDA